MEIINTSKKISHLYQLFISEYTNYNFNHKFNVRDYNIFLTIQENPGCNQLFLANKRHVQRSLLTRIISKYVSEGLIKRETNLKNMSAYSLFLTASGEELAQQIREKISQLNRKIASYCSSEQYKQFNKTLEMLIKKWEIEQ